MSRAGNQQDGPSSAGELLAYSVVSIVFLVIVAAGWPVVADNIWGLYSLDDGELAFWTPRSIYEWAKPLDLSPFNLFQGMGSLYIPNLPWINPGALVLLLPLDRPALHYVSYAVYAVEVMVSIVLLGRALGLSLLRSLVAAQLFVLFVFPPFAFSFQTVPWINLAPYYAHVFAVCNVILALFAMLGTGSVLRNALVATALAVFMVVALYSNPFTLILYVPVYCVFGGVILLGDLSPRPLRWRLVTLAVLAAAFVVAGGIAFYQGSIAVTSRYYESFGNPPGRFLDRLWDVLTGFKLCGDPQFIFCIGRDVFYFHVLGLIGACYAAVFARGMLRKAAWGLLVAFVGVTGFFFAHAAWLPGPPGQMSPVYFLFASYAFWALFAAIAVCLPLDALEWLLGRRKADASALPLFVKTVALGLIPLVSTFMLKRVEADMHEKAPLKRWVRGQPLPPTRIRGPERNPIIDTLEREIALAPGRAFRGYAATFFGASDSALRKKIGIGRDDHFSSDVYVRSRFYMLGRYGTRFMFTDLWEFNIPTLEEYGQWVTQQMFLFSTQMLSNPGDAHFPSFINVYRPDLTVLQLLGVRFLITDAVIDDPRARLRVTYLLDASTPPMRPGSAWLSNAGEALAEPTVAVRLYELPDANVANYSPVQVLRAGTAAQTFDMLKAAGTRVKEQVILREPLKGSLMPVHRSTLSVEQGRLHVTAESDGQSLLVLPLQYSRCLTLQQREAGSPTALLYRANLVQTAVLFDRKLDADLSFDFGLGRSSGCRSEDLEDYRALGITRTSAQP